MLPTTSRPAVSGSSSSSLSESSARHGLRSPVSSAPTRKARSRGDLVACSRRPSAVVVVGVSVIALLLPYGRRQKRPDQWPERASRWCWSIVYAYHGRSLTSAGLLIIVAC